VKKKESAPERIPLYDSNNMNPDDLDFRVKEKVNEEGTTQRTIEFDMNEGTSQSILLFPEETSTEYQIKVNPHKSEPIPAPKKPAVRVTESGYNSAGEKSNIDQLENVPAYVRKKVQIDQQPTTDTTISKFSLSTDEDNNVRLRQNNSYLYDNVD
jgi:hypothetical protein